MMTIDGRAESAGVPDQERLVKILAVATFLIFFQAYMVAPLIPRLSAVFGVSSRMIGLIVPAYMIPYGLSTLFYGALSDRIGRRRIMLASLFLFVALTALTAMARTASQLIAWRLLTGLGASGVVPLALAFIGQAYPFERRGRPLGWLFGAMAGGMAFGSTFGAIGEAVIGWKGIFIAVAAGAALILAVLVPKRSLLGEASPAGPASVRDLLTTYRELLSPGRGLRTYAYVFLNAIFHSGVYTWLGLYFHERFHLGETGIGLGLLGYGVPGFSFGPIIGHAADRYGRRWLVPSGLAVAALGAAVLGTPISIVAAALAVAVVSLGYDMTQPLLAGIVTAIGGKRAGQAMGLNVFLLFTGFGLGSVFFGQVLSLGFTGALIIFASVQVLGGLLAIPLFRAEGVPRKA